MLQVKLLWSRGNRFRFVLSFGQKIVLKTEELKKHRSILMSFEDIFKCDTVSSSIISTWLDFIMNYMIEFNYSYKI